jgi:hypothetical protein
MRRRKQEVDSVDVGPTSIAEQLLCAVAVVLHVETAREAAGACALSPTTGAFRSGALKERPPSALSRRLKLLSRMVQAATSVQGGIPMRLFMLFALMPPIGAHRPPCAVQNSKFSTKRTAIGTAATPLIDMGAAATRADAGGAQAVLATTLTAPRPRAGVFSRDQVSMAAGSWDDADSPTKEGGRPIPGK